VDRKREKIRDAWAGKEGTDSEGGYLNTKKNLTKVTLTARRPCGGRNEPGANNMAGKQVGMAALEGNQEGGEEKA